MQMVCLTSLPLARGSSNTTMFEKDPNDHESNLASPSTPHGQGCSIDLLVWFCMGIITGKKVSTSHQCHPILWVLHFEANRRMSRNPATTAGLESVGRSAGSKKSMVAADVSRNLMQFGSTCLVKNLSSKWYPRIVAQWEGSSPSHMIIHRFYRYWYSFWPPIWLAESHLNAVEVGLRDCSSSAMISNQL